MTELVKIAFTFNDTKELMISENQLFSQKF